MIISVKDADIESLCRFCENGLLGTKISCHLKTYGTEWEFCNTWYYSDGENISAVISKFENSITLICESDADLSEIKAFLDMLGFTSLCCNETTAQSLGYDITSTKAAYVFCGESESEKLDDLTEEYYKSAYELISKSIPDSFDNSKNAYLSFLSDFTFRKRRGVARIKGTLIDGRVASCALTSTETENSAIISGVACDSELRRKGLGKITVLGLANELTSENKTVYVIALNKSAEGFYEHIGFKNTERISFIERK